MTRIISGAAGSLTLAVPDAGTRPTSDRVRESLFGALDSLDAIEDARVLDLYAGSGALALEAMSRGAATADLVERAPHAATVAERNARAVARALTQSGRAAVAIRVHRAAAEAYLRTAGTTFDLVFVDPPYDVTENELSRTLEMLAPLLSPEAVVIVERAARSPEPVLPSGVELLRTKRYGDTALWWFGPA